MKTSHDEYTWLFCESYELADKGITMEAERADFLFIDDLGSETPSSKFGNALLHLIRRRCDWRRPTFISTQLTTDRFKSRFFEGTAPEAILRRLREHAIGIHTD